ncbi:MAG: hypothetical protein MUP48_01315 [Wolbachia endosymbiont of Homalodisca vitripennis]|nr:hypothetical protein [Wolbachia endosymbiont of Homalodisca vitripennis]MCJ7475788.1 hypothetical protein [Wolbachia endosymbiont of Homalodisca vitripennis]
MAPITAVAPMMRRSGSEVVIIHISIHKPAMSIPTIIPMKAPTIMDETTPINFPIFELSGTSLLPPTQPLNFALIFLQHP